jgi:hypothetical protein
LFLAGLSDGAGAGEMYLAKEINTELRELLTTGERNFAEC